MLGNTGDSSPTPTSTPTGALPPIAVAAPPSNPAAVDPCTKVLAQLPVQLTGLPGRPAQSTSPFVAAWGDPAVVVRCGVARPAGLVPGSSAFLPGINGVFYWLDQTKKVNVYTAIDRAAYIEVSVPTQYASAPMSDLSSAIAKALPPVCEVSATADPAKLCTHRP